METPELSAVVLCYHSGANARELAQTLIADLDAAGITYELVLVANYWPEGDDDTPQIVEQLAQENGHVHPVIRPKEGAMGWDMRTGLAAATGRYLIVIDGDRQNPPEDVLRMYRELKRTGLPVMKGRRETRFDGVYRRIVSIVYNAAFRLFFRTKGLWDINGKPKGLTREAYEQMHLVSRDWFTDAEIVLQAQRLGLQIGEMPVTFFDSERRSLVRPSAILEFLVNMVLVRLRGRPRE